MKAGKTHSGDLYRRTKLQLENIPNPKVPTRDDRKALDPAVREKMSAAGDRAEDTVERLLTYLLCNGFVQEFTRSQRFDDDDLCGIDFRGRLSDTCGGIAFKIDAKSSRREVTRYQRAREARRENLIFVPRAYAPIEDEAMSLLRQIQRHFHKRRRRKT